jgi:hypothetical protein
VAVVAVVVMVRLVTLILVVMVGLVQVRLSMAQRLLGQAAAVPPPRLGPKELVVLVAAVMGG